MCGSFTAAKEQYTACMQAGLSDIVAWGSRASEELAEAPKESLGHVSVHIGRTRNVLGPRSIPGLRTSASRLRGSNHAVYSSDSLIQQPAGPG